MLRIVRYATLTAVLLSLPVAALAQPTDRTCTIVYSSTGIELIGEACEHARVESADPICGSLGSQNTTFEDYAKRWNLLNKKAAAHAAGADGMISLAEIQGLASSPYLGYRLVADNVSHFEVYSYPEFRGDGVPLETYLDSARKYVFATGRDAAGDDGWLSFEDSNNALPEDLRADMNFIRGKSADGRKDLDCSAHTASLKETKVNWTPKGRYGRINNWKMLRDAWVRATGYLAKAAAGTDGVLSKSEAIAARDHAGEVGETFGDNLVDLFDGTTSRLSLDTIKSKLSRSVNAAIGQVLGDTPLDRRFLAHDEIDQMSPRFRPDFEYLRYRSRSQTEPATDEKILFSGWTAMSGGKKGGVEYGTYSPWPDDNPDFRGEGLYRVNATLTETGEGADRQRHLELEWYKVITPPGEPETYPYRWWVNPQGQRKNVPVEDLEWETSPSKVDVADIELDRGRPDGYFLYNARTEIDGRTWQLTVKKGYNGGPLRVDLDSNQPGSGIWSERQSELRETTFDIGKLTDAPHSVKYEWVAASDLSASDKAKIQEIIDAYPPSGDGSDPDWIPSVETGIQNPPNGAFMDQSQQDIILKNLATLESQFPSGPGYEIYGDMGEYEFVTNADGKVIAVIAGIGIERDSWGGMSCSFSVIKTIDPADQSAGAYVKLNRGYCD